MRERGAGANLPMIGDERHIMILFVLAFGCSAQISQQPAHYRDSPMIGQTLPVLCGYTMPQSLSIMCYGGFFTTGPCRPVCFQQIKTPSPSVDR
ncbi:hypothetical protein V8F20_009459 [Naviculisporaceae sp. PSN 640]